MHSIYKKRNIVISYAHPKEEFISTIPKNKYSNFRLYSLRKGNIIRYKHELNDTKSFIYTNYPYKEFTNNNVNSDNNSDTIDTTDYYSDKFIKHQFILKNIILIVYIHEIKVKETMKDEIILPYTFLQLPLEIKNLSCDDSDKEILTKGYNYVVLNHRDYSQMEYYRIFEIYRRNIKKLKTLLNGKSLRLDIYRISSKDYLCKLIENLIENEKYLNCNKNTDVNREFQFDINKSNIIERKLIFFE